MPLSKEDRSALWDIIESARAIVGFTRGATFDDYLKNRLLRKGIEREIETIGEAARRLSAEFRSMTPDIPWRKIIGQRNVLVHEYDEIDDSRIWALTQNEIPSLLAQIEVFDVSPPETGN